MKDSLKKENYRPASLLPHVSKVSERVIYKQINSYMEEKLSKYITSFRKAHGTQHSLIAMLEKWKRVVDKREYVCCLFMDLPKDFDTINHDLLLAKLKTYSFSNKSLALMCNYLQNRKQRRQINNCFSSVKKVIVGVPQGSINGSLLFDLLINDLVLFLAQCFLSNYADDNNLYSMGNNLELAKIDLQTGFRAITNCFFENYMILNSEKFH